VRVPRCSRSGRHDRDKPVARPEAKLTCHTRGLTRRCSRRQPRRGFRKLLRFRFRLPRLGGRSVRRAGEYSMPTILRKIALAGLFALLLLPLILIVNERRKPQPVLLQYELRCGLSSKQSVALAKKFGYTECSAPTASGDVPSYGCSGNGRWVAFWFRDDSLHSFMFGDSYADECDSGCASERLDLCVHGKREAGAQARLTRSLHRTRPA
jgi:hypothetical protein